MVEEVRIQLNGPQTLARRLVGRSRTIALIWSRGTGKSFIQRLIAYSLISEWDGRVMPGAPRTGFRVVFLFDTLEHYKDVHGRLMIQELDGPFRGLGATYDRSTYHISFPGGSWIHPVPAREYNSQKGRGIRCDAIMCDESDDIDESVYASVAVPWFSEPWSYKLAMLAGTPRKGRYGLLYRMHSMGLDASCPNHYTLHATYRDAPETVDERAVEEARRLMSPAVFAREWESISKRLRELRWAVKLEMKNLLIISRLDQALGSVVAIELDPALARTITQFESPISMKLHR